MISRRTFLSGSAAAGLVSVGGLPPAFLCRAALANPRVVSERGGRILVILQLEGGNDGLNTVVPYRDDEYYKARPGIGIPREAVLRLNDELALHPQLAGFKELFDEGKLAIVQGVGYPQPDRSHFRSLDIWQSASPGTQSPDRGWIGRALDLAAEETHALAIGLKRLPLTMMAANVNVPTIEDINGFMLNTGPDDADGRTRRKLIRQLAAHEGAGSSTLTMLQQAAQSAYDASERFRDVASRYQSSAEYPNSQLANHLKLIAQIICGELGVRIFFVSLGGFDTHSQQPGAHQALLAEVASAVRTFFSDLHGHGLGEQVLLATYSEFGRRVKENGSLGTDHGAASQMFIVTPGKGGLFGAHPSLTDLDDGDLKFHTDFRSVYATLLEKWLGFPAEPVLGGRFGTLEFV